MSKIEELKESVKNYPKDLLTQHDLIELNIFKSWQEAKEFDKKTKFTAKYAAINKSNLKLFSKEKILQFLQEDEDVFKLSCTKTPENYPYETQNIPNPTTTIDELVSKFKEFLVKTYVYGTNN